MYILPTVDKVDTTSVKCLLVKLSKLVNLISLKEIYILYVYREHFILCSAGKTVKIFLFFSKYIDFRKEKLFYKHRVGEVGLLLKRKITNLIGSNLNTVEKIPLFARSVKQLGLKKFFSS